jgi:hypothetical protein
MFMGTALLIKKKLLDNDPTFFRKFSARRARLENALVEHKQTIAAILQGYVSKHRVEKYFALIDALIDRLGTDQPVTSEDIVTLSGLAGKVFVGTDSTDNATFSDAVRSETFIRKSLEHAVKCSVCGGYLDPAKSVSYDHITRRREGGSGRTDNCELTHPYCNQSIRNYTNE